MRRTLLILTIVFAAFALNGCSYNELNQKQQTVKGKWANIEVQLQRRADLIPNLVKAAKTAGIQEQEVFGRIADARSRLLNAVKEEPKGDGGIKTPEQKQAILAANNSFGGTIGRLLALRESYPVLRSNENFLKLQDSLEGTENRIGVARTDYNQAVTDYNTTRNSFPTIITASLIGFPEEPFFKAEQRAQTAPDVGDPESIRDK